MQFEREFGDGSPLWDLPSCIRLLVDGFNSHSNVARRREDDAISEKMVAQPSDVA